jgi:hypothetical protein
VIRAVNHFFFGNSFGGLYLRLWHRWWLFLRTGSLELEQGYSLRHTYCMHMHKINIMDA